MRRVLLWSLLSAFVLVLLAVVIVESRAVDAELSAPDPRQVIRLPDGAELTLSELLQRTLPGARGRVEPLSAREPPTEGATAAAAVSPGTSPAGQLEALYPGMPWGPVFRLGEHHRQAGRLDQALALFQSIPEGDPDYARARRRIAWDILTVGRGEPRAAVGVVRQALAADPLDPNAWQAVVQVYARTLGIPLE